MSDTHKSTRLGDLLIERGAITRQQLAQAIEVQQERRLQDVQNNRPVSKQSELGEVLIDLGFINRRQLDSGLTWQRRLRKTTMVMAFIAPLLTAACGGGASAASANTSTGNTQTTGASTQVVNSPKPSDSQAGVSSSSLGQTTSPKPASSAASSSAQQTAPSITPKQNSSSSASSSPAVAVNGPVAIYWSTPDQRENGEYLEYDEIGGYELRYKLRSEEVYKTIYLEADLEEYIFDYLEGDYEFEIATFDTDGLYSKYASINPH